MYSLQIRIIDTFYDSNLGRCIMYVYIFFTDLILHTYVYNGDRIPMPLPIIKETVSFPQYNFAGYQMCYPKKTGNLSSPPFALIPIFAA
jgi:hypothetical protein